MISMFLMMSFTVDKRHLKIDLGEFRLPVRPEVFVPETLHDLEIFFEAGYHQYLFEDLRGLGERIEMPWIQTARDKIIPCAFRGGFCEHGGLDFEKPLFIEIIPDDLCHLMACDEILLHLGSSEIKIAVFQPERSLMHQQRLLS